MHDDVSFGQWLKQQRKARDLTQADLARLVGCAAVTLRKIEAGTLRPSRQVAERLADCLKLAPDQHVAFIEFARAAPGAAGLAAPALIAALTPRRRQRAPANWPAPLTPLIGRDHQLATIHNRLVRTDARLLTLIGPPGVGKTRLALEVAAGLLDDFEDGVVFVSLAPLNDPNLVGSTIAQTLGLKETGGQPLVARLTDYLRDKQLLLVLDNFEQVVAAAPLIAELLAACRWLSVLATSREALRMRGERRIPVPPLALPDRIQPAGADLVSRAPAVALFVERAQAAQPDFALTDTNAPAVALICARLDGLPLAIELAAARLTLFTPQTLLERLDNRLKLLTGGARDLAARQQTLRNAIAWSYDLLDEREKILFSRLGVFVGGCTLEAAEAACNVDGDLSIDVLEGVSALVDKSLLRQEAGAGDEPRFTMLETIREYALERLAASGAEADIRHRHASFFLAQAEGIEPEQAARLATDYDNFRGALAWLIACGEWALACRLWLALRNRGFWWNRGYLSEGRRWLTPLLANRQCVPATILKRVLHEAGWLAYWQGDYAAARTCREDALALARESGDELGTADALFYLGEVSDSQGDHDAARHAWETSLTIYRASGAKDGMAATFIRLGLQARELGDARQAAAHFEESLALFRETGNTWGDAVALFNLGFAVQQQDDWERAGALFRESLAHWQEQGDPWGVAHCLVGLAGDAGARGQPARAARLFGATEALHNTTGLQLEPVDQLQHDRNIAVARAQLDEATFAAAWAEGRALSLEQAVAYALDEALNR